MNSGTRSGCRYPNNRCSCKEDKQASTSTWKASEVNTHQRHSDQLQVPAVLLADRLRQSRTHASQAPSELPPAKSWTVKRTLWPVQSSSLYTRATACLLNSQKSTGTGSIRRVGGVERSSAVFQITVPSVPIVDRGGSTVSNKKKEQRTQIEERSNNKNEKKK